jgi:excisionase family DNA binding protein
MTAAERNPDRELLTVNEVADELRVSSMTIYRLVKAGRLEAVRVGKNYRIRRSALDTYLGGARTVGGETA